MHRSILFYLHLLISGLHHHFSIQRHYSPLAGIPFKSTITAYGNTDIPVTRRHYDTISPISAPHFIPIRKGRTSFISSSLFRLFSSSFCCRSRCTLSARRPASFLRPSTTEAKSASPALGALQAIYRSPFLSPHDNSFLPRPSPRCSDPPNNHNTSTPLHHPLPARRRRHQI